jgi:uncharacterized protein YraI
MKKRPLIGLLLLASAMLACDLPLSATATPASLGPILLTPVQQEEIATPIDTAVATALGPAPVLVFTATPVIVATPTVPMVTPNAVDVNCRTGPDLAYDPVSALPFGGWSNVTGRTADSSWWYVQDPNNPTGSCWVFSGVVTIAGPTAAIPVAALPAAIANKVTVAVVVPASPACGAQNPVMFSGTISTNGAASVQYQWEVTGNVTNTTTPQTLVFTAAGTQDITNPVAFSVGCGGYNVTLHVTSPNDLSASKTFQITEP